MTTAEQVLRIAVAEAAAIISGLLTDPASLPEGQLEQTKSEARSWLDRWETGDSEVVS